METTNDITNNMNAGIYGRNIPSKPLQPYLNVRPVLTKYSKLPIVDPRKETKTPLMQLETYNIHNTFNPGTDSAPWSGYASNVNLESELRNQIFALQKSSQSVYVPKSTSSLYKYNYQNSKTIPMNNPLLFQENTFEPFNPNPENTGYQLFNNSTRVQVRDLTGKSNNSNSSNN